ncbi:MAG TPA: S41 family peptidase, partial [Longimicrobiales bacterium]|nr:S41 family peptidase [Longimicrobiales bacterium]
DCVHVLRRLTAWFEDDHLFISESPSVDSAESVRLARDRERLDVDEDALRAHFQRHASPDPIEGIWYDRGRRVAVLRSEQDDRDFVAVTLADSMPRWEPGMVRAEFRARGDGYDVVYYADDHSPRHYQARMHKGVLLRMPPVMWGKELPLARHERGLLHPEDPRLPAFRSVDSRTVVIGLPSHAPAVAGPLEALVSRHRDELLAAETLIIDLRGNEGGSSLTTRVLAPFYASSTLRPPLVPENNVPAYLASPDNAAYLRSLVADSDLPPWVDAFLQEMEQNPGRVLPLPPEGRRPGGPFRPDTIHDSPRRVAILVDGGVVSAGEALVLDAMRSERVTVYGENSGGAIDYQNVRLVWLGCPERGLLLGYPTVAASARLPEGGLNATGIAPHVRIPGSVDDWVAYVMTVPAAASTHPVEELRHPDRL